jgi:hypothetical protein
MFLNLLRIQRIQRLQREFEIRNQRITPRFRKVLAHHHTQHLHLLRVRRHGVRRDNPAAFAELMGSAARVSPCVKQEEREDLHCKLIILLS